MSISGSQEVKTAILEAQAAAGATVVSELDAQEDREIVGLNITHRPDAGEASPGSADSNVVLRIGRSAFEEPALGESHEADNRSLAIASRARSHHDETNAQASDDGRNHPVWFGHGSGVEWNEDATLTLEATAGGGSTTVDATVYYREL